jgi:alanyl-tRNA synthetase
MCKSCGPPSPLPRILFALFPDSPNPHASQEGFFAKLVDTVVDAFGPTYPELVSARATLAAVISEEEAAFSRTLDKGIERFKKLAAAASVRELAPGV